MRQLRVFVATAREGGVAAASRTLRLAPASVSVTLRDLEATLGVKLFERGTHRLRLNPAGTALLGDAERLLLSARNLAARHGQQRLAIGASVTVGNYLLAPLLQALRVRHPALQVEVLVRNTEQMCEAVLSGRVDLAFVEGPFSRPELHVSRWRSDPLVVFAAADHPLAPGASSAQLQAASWILREEGAGTRKSFDAIVAGWPAAPKVVLTLGGNELIKTMVKNGDALGCLSEAAVAGEVGRGELAIVPTPFPMLDRELSIISRSHLPTGGPITTLVEACARTIN
ncbi:LysR family transcriptional regulator [Phenylobacterium sp. LjRoot219]|uniref:LysR family transcriptional regulator n=1 Tax=Phenylobacterium sp. LjRoot219 TaxID=3342283 RepID=UPI003ECDA96F